MSDLLTLTLWRFAAASAISVAVAALLYAMLALAARRWPALAARRSAWLLAQAAVVATFVLALAPPALPGGPLITVRADVLALGASNDGASARAAARAPTSAASWAATSTSAATGASAPAAAQINAAATGTAAASIVPPAASANVAGIASAAAVAQRALALALPWLAAAWLLVYVAGLLWRGLRGARNHLRWQALLGMARRLDTTALRQHGAFSATQLMQMREHTLEVLETAAPVSPMLIGALRPRLVLPASLRILDDAQQALIVAHELTHWRRRDTLWLAASGTLQSVFWFNLPLLWLGRRLHWAVELGCDSAVLEGRSLHERHNYAAALVSQLRQQHTAHAGAAFGTLAVRERIERMRGTTIMRVPAAGTLALSAAGAVIVAASVLLQPAFAARDSTPTPVAMAAILAPAAPSAAAAAAAQAWRYPLDQVHVSSLYGVVSARLPEGHHGIDFKARRGTPVHAVAQGTVIEAAFDKQYGNYVRINHGNGRQSLSIHLDSSTVRIGDTVQAGQRIGAAGDTGMASGPHLHLEYWQDGQRRDPALMFPDLDTHASATALTRRAAQQPRAG